MTREELEWRRLGRIWRAIWEGAVNGFALVGVVTCFLIAYLHFVGVPK